MTCKYTWLFLSYLFSWIYLLFATVMCHGDIFNLHCKQHSFIQQIRWEDKHFESIASWEGICARTCAHFLIAAVNCFKAVVMMMSYHYLLISCRRACSWSTLPELDWWRSIWQKVLNREIKKRTWNFKTLMKNSLLKSYCLEDYMNFFSCDLFKWPCSEFHSENHLEIFFIGMFEKLKKNSSYTW